ncbi:hypothetical protein F5B21DRAFT_479319 [Xylaria acuta]|nr:hypothetical protein F5B21DRAFT_479319 [Xylaria acuta]
MEISFYLVIKISGIGGLVPGALLERSTHIEMLLHLASPLVTVCGFLTIVSILSRIFWLGESRGFLPLGFL